jgi:SHS2 domain-containing protein
MPMPEERKDFEFLDHPADAKFRAFGQSLEEAFRNAAYALASLMWDREKIRPKIVHEVAVDGRDRKQLLLNYLEEVLFVLDAQGFLLHSVGELIIVREEGRYALKGLFRGDVFEEGQEIFGDVKAITYHEMMIEENDQVMVQVVVDV